MKSSDNETSQHWVSAKELALPTDYKEICECSAARIEQGHAALEQASSRKLADFYESMGKGEIRSLRSRLLFVTAMLLEQTAESTHKREMIQQLRRLHRDNPLYPSVATVYRVAAPLKVWLGQKCGMKKPPSVGDLRTDKRPLLMLTEENLLELADECKTTRKFAEQYRARRGHKDTLPASAEKSEVPLKASEMDAAPAVVIIGKLTPATLKKIAAALGTECQLFNLDEPRAAMVTKWVKP